MKVKMLQSEDFPPFVKKEIERLEQALEPDIKKTTTYSFWALPLIIISFFNVVFLLTVTPAGYFPLSIFYALIGAVGLAFSKEARRRQKEVMKRSADYMVERIEKSDAAEMVVKQKYTVLVQQQPVKSFTYFVEFLEEENKAKRISLYGGWKSQDE